MSVNDESAASRQFVASSPSMSSQMTAFATGKGRYGVQASGFALILVMVVGFVTRRSQGMAIAAAGLVALSISVWRGPRTCGGVRAERSSLASRAMA
jgi:hypothetical protein